MSHRPVPPHQSANAKRLRRTMTDVERKLWYALQGAQLGGVRFRRQVPIGPYIVDFASHEARLVIELDGGQHNEAANIARNQVRDGFLVDAGYRVLRFWNFEVNADFNVVVDRIYIALIEQGLSLESSGLSATPHPVPPPQGGRRRKTQDPALTPTFMCEPRSLPSLTLGVSSPLEGEGQGGG